MAADHLHSPTPEEVMEYVDGEGTPAARAGIEAHLAACPACQALAGQQRGLSRDLAAWQVAPAPDTFRAPQPGGRIVVRRWWRPSPSVMAGLSVAAVILIIASYQALRAPQRSVMARTGNESVVNEERKPVATVAIADGAAAGGSRADVRAAPP